MGKRRTSGDDGIRLLAGLGILLLGAWVFAPSLRPAMIGLAILATLAGLAAVAIGNRKSNQAADLASSGNALEVFANVMKPQPAGQPAPEESAHTTVLAALRRVDWFHFEKVIEALYLSHGYTVRRLGGAHPDGGVDLIVTTPHDQFVVQCKHWLRDLVGVKNIRELLGTLTDSRITKGVYVTMRGYSNEARDAGVRNGLVLLDENQLVELIIALGPDHGARVVELLNDPRKFCPKCERVMVLRTARRGAGLANSSGAARPIRVVTGHSKPIRISLCELDTTADSLVLNNFN